MTFQWRIKALVCVLSASCLSMGISLWASVPAWADQDCKTGYKWVSTTTDNSSVENASTEKSASVIFRESSASGYCKWVGGKRSDPSSRGKGARPTYSSPTGERFCRVDSEVEGISDAEMDSGYLVVNGNRWRKCPDGVEEIGDPTAESMTLDLDALARSLAVQLNLPDATPIFSPDPNNNEWKMLAVGFPIWLRTDGPDSKSTTASTQGLTFRLSATRTSTTFTMGDGKTITCNAMARYSDTVKAGSPSPNCGHTYQQPSGKNDRYTVTGTHHWTVTWSVDSFSGSFPMTYSDSSTIRIGELSALNR